MPQIMNLLAICLLVLLKISSITTTTNEADVDNSLDLNTIISESREEEICNVVDVILFDKNMNETAVLTERLDTLNTTKTNNNQKFKRHASEVPTDYQRSLLIIFDGTGSMSNDLSQLRAAAKEIIADLATHEENPIFNYVLVVFRDPDVDRPINTKNSIDLLNALDQVGIYGGHDCPEATLKGIRTAVKYALPNSIAFVFTDASSNDYRDLPIVQKELQSKQISVNFLLTGDCTKKLTTEKELKTFEKIARSTNGQIFNMNKTDTRDVLLAIRSLISPKAAELKSISKDSPGENKIDLKIDTTIKEFSVSLSGKAPEINIRDPKNDSTEGERLKLDSLEIVNIKDPMAGVWNVQSRSSSAHSLKLSGISDVIMKYGFSLSVPSKFSEVNFQPIDGGSNVLSIFLSDSGPVEKLEKVTIKLYSNNANEETISFDLNLTKLREDLYVTEPFSTPRNLFKIQVSGTDRDKNPIERLVSSAVQVIRPIQPKVTITSSANEVFEGRKIEMKCNVKSMIPTTIYWEFNGNSLKKLKVNQSSESELTIDAAKMTDSGSYKCSARNSEGSDSKEMILSVYPIPSVTVTPKSITLIENSTLNLECLLENSFEKMPYALEWIDKAGNVILINEELFPVENVNRNLDKSRFTCRVNISNFVLTDSADVTVEYPPNFVVDYGSYLEIEHNKPFILNCENDANPSSEITWFHFKNPENKSNATLIAEGNQYLEFNQMIAEIEGYYECIVENKLAKISRRFQVVDRPNSSPQITGNLRKDVTIGEDLELLCECENCMPIKNFTWMKINGTFGNRFKFRSQQSGNSSNFSYNLLIGNVSETDAGWYECYLSNDLGSKRQEIFVNVRIPPKFNAFEILVNEESTQSTDSQFVVLENSNVQITCSGSGNPEASVVWFKDGELIFESQSLAFPSIQRQDNGTYQCEIANQLGSDKRDIAIIIEFPPEPSENNATAENSTQSVIEGQQVQFSCEINGNPKPTVNWIHNGLNVLEIEDSKFNISDADGESFINFQASSTDSGVFTCFKNNSLGSISEDFYVVVNSLPRIYPSNDEFVKARLGEDVLLHCDVTGHPQPTVTWKSDHEIPSSNNSHLFFQNVQGSQSGAYVCDAENVVGISQKVFYLTVTEVPKIQTEFTNISIKANESVNLTCVSSGIPTPKIMWRFRNQIIEESQEILLNSSFESGTYDCYSINSEGDDSKSFHFEVLAEPILTEDVLATIEQTQEVTFGDSLELICPYGNFQELSWFLNGEPVFSHKEKSDNILVIPAVDSTHNGNVSCVALNSAGSKSFSYNIEVLYPPKILTDPRVSNRISAFLNDEDDPEEMVYKIGDNMRINCSAEGNPKPKIMWKKSGDVIAFGEILEIPNLNFHHQDIYTCVAENNLGHNKKSFKVEITSPPILLSKKLQKYYQLNLGDNVDLKCKMIGNPPLTVFWFKDNILLEDETDINLKITNATLETKGTYKCLGRNKFGAEKIEYHIDILEPATIQFVLNEVKIRMPNSDPIQISCVARGNPLPVLSIIFEGKVLSTTSRLNLTKVFEIHKFSPIYFDNRGNGVSIFNPFQLNRNTKVKSFSQLNKINSNSFKLDLHINHPDKDVAGKYYCVTYNAIGRDEKVTTLRVFEPPRFRKNLMLSMEQSEVLEGLPLILPCLVTAEPYPNITWFKNKVPLESNDRIKIINGNQILNIDETTLIDSGTYTCAAENEVGYIEFDFIVRVLVPPKFVEVTVDGVDNLDRNYYSDKKIQNNDEFDETEDVNVTRAVKGETIRLDCHFVGEPVPEIYWAKINYMDESKSEILMQHENYLDIKNIQESAIFMCFANNTVGVAKKIFQIVVESGPELDANVKSESRQTVELYHGLNLECRINAMPEPVISWYYNGSAINTSDSNFYFSSDRKVLRIISAQKSSSGKYLCKGENEFGKVEQVIYVEVELPIQWSPWSSYSACSATCGNGTQYRTRICLLSNGIPVKGDEYKCVGENVEMKSCYLLPCPVNGGWSQWTKWSDENCAVKCVNETDKKPVKKRYRKCDSPAPAWGGKPCVGAEWEEEECPDIQPCPVHGGWSKWSEWKSCSKSCGIGMTSRFRTCTNPAPRNGGKYCDGMKLDVKYCNLNPCPINGGWSPFTSWSSCSKTCGRSVRKRSRSCNNPEPLYNGLDCPGENVEYEDCNLPPCFKVKSFYDDDYGEAAAKYGPYAEFDVENRFNGRGNLLQKEVEYVTPKISNIPNVPKVVVSLDTYRPISAETYEFLKNGHVRNDPKIPSLEEEFSFSYDDGNDAEFFSVEDTSEEVEFENFDQKNCRKGFYYNEDNNQCMDINECTVEPLKCPRNSQCVNLPGSYRCDCQNGFTNIKGKCLDANECSLKTAGCSHICENLVGSFRCKCPENMQLMEDGKTCENIHSEIKRFPRDDEVFGCGDGFRKVNGTCVDEDECSNLTSECEDNQMCLNTNGSYLCIPIQCPVDYEIDEKQAKQCIQVCSEKSDHRCDLLDDPHDEGKSESLKAKIIRYIGISKSIANISNKLPILRLLNYDLNDMPLKHSEFFFSSDSTENIASIFSIEKKMIDSGLGMLFVNKSKLQTNKIYNINILSNSYDDTNNLTYVNFYRIYFYSF